MAHQSAGDGTALRLSRYQPYRVIPRPVYPVYGESLHVDFRGEWSYDLSWKPVAGFPIRLGWLGAVHAAQRRLRAGLSIDVPVLVACSTRSYRGIRWHELARRSDSVLDVRDMLRWAPFLGRHVTILQVNGGMHDLTLSARTGPGVVLRRSRPLAGHVRRRFPRARPGRSWPPHPRYATPPETAGGTLW